jgi:hypothetical protein
MAFMSWCLEHASIPMVQVLLVLSIPVLKTLSFSRENTLIHLV